MELLNIVIYDKNLFLDINGDIDPSRGIINIDYADKTFINPGVMINGFYGELTIIRYFCSFSFSYN